MNRIKIILFILPILPSCFNFLFKNETQNAKNMNHVFYIFIFSPCPPCLRGKKIFLKEHEKRFTTETRSTRRRKKEK